jgi:hypothetical protein
MRLRQSYSGYLLGRNGKTLRELREDIEHGRTPTKAMEDGALVDQILYGGHTYCEVQPCTKRSGPNKGEVFEPEDWTSEDAKAQRKEARARGQVCCLKSEVDQAMSQKQSLIEALAEEGIDLSNEHNRMMGAELGSDEYPEGIVRPRPGIYTQPKLLWNANGVQCHGTLDILEIRDDMTWRIVDTKLSVRCDQEWVSAQAAKMGWDTQSGAYVEACILSLGLKPEDFKGYGIAVCEKRSGLSMSAVHWLEDMFLHCGEKLWERCKAVWSEAVKNDEWPGVSGGAISPPGYHVSSIFDAVDSGGADNLSSIGLDVSGLETEQE